MRGHKDLIVWQKSKDLAIVVYRVTESFPKCEQFGIASQIRRSAISIPSNIAEGSRRNSRKEFLNFLSIAYASGAELETQLIIACEVGLLSRSDYNTLEANLNEIMRILNTMTSKTKD